MVSRNLSVFTALHRPPTFSKPDGKCRWIDRTETPSALAAWARDSLGSRDIAALTCRALVRASAERRGRLERGIDTARERGLFARLDRDILTLIDFDLLRALEETFPGTFWRSRCLRAIGHLICY